MEWRGHLPRSKPQHIAPAIKSLNVLNKKIIECNACARLEKWCKTVASEKRRAYAAEEYWGRPIPSFGPTDAKILIVGLAPGAHGANRTGRIFTGDRSGDWLYGSLYRNGLAKIPTSTARNDGQELYGTRIACAVRCAPPENKPSTEESARCAPYLLREVELLLPTVRSFLVLGNFAWKALLNTFQSLDPVAFKEYLRPLPRFGHGASFRIVLRDGVERYVVGSYHPSQQNTFTGKLTEGALDAVVKIAVKRAR